jgi:hypothetical protein
VVLDAAGGCAVLSLVAPQSSPTPASKLCGAATSSSSSSNTSTQGRASSAGAPAAPANSADAVGSTPGGVGLMGSLMMGTSLTLMEPNLVMVKAEVGGKVSRWEES